MQSLSIIVPCLNEAAALPELVRRLRRPGTDTPSVPIDPITEVILVDDGSGDATWETIQTLGADTPWLRGLRHDRRQGIPAAWRTALAAAKGDRICVLDADLQYDPEEIPRLCAALDATGADVVQGSRARDERRMDVRYLLSRGLNALLNRVFGMNLTDNKSGYFICRREVLADLLGHRGRYRHWQCFVMVAAHARGYRIHQMNTPFRPRRSGRSAFGGLPLKATVEVAVDLVQAVREYRRPG